MPIICAHNDENANRAIIAYLPNFLFAMLHLN